MQKSISSLNSASLKSSLSKESMKNNLNAYKENDYKNYINSKIEVNHQQNNSLENYYSQYMNK